MWGADIHSIFSAVFKRVPSKMFDDLIKDLGKGVQDLLYSWVGDLVNNVSHIIFECLLTLLYMMFWLCSPMPIRDNLDRLFRRYILMKTMVSFGYALCITALLFMLNVDLAAVFGLINFVLNFVPEVLFFCKKQFQKRFELLEHVFKIFFLFFHNL